VVTPFVSWELSNLGTVYRALPQGTRSLLARTRTERPEET
jgi:hypothetical protein